MQSPHVFATCSTECNVPSASASELEWRKSSASAGNGQCVEVAGFEGVAGFSGGVLVRDSKDPDGPILRFTVDEWQAFLAGARNAEFDYGRLLEPCRAS